MRSKRQMNQSLIVTSRSKLGLQTSLFQSAIATALLQTSCAIPVDLVMPPENVGGEGSLVFYSRATAGGWGSAIISNKLSL